MRTRRRAEDAFFDQPGTRSRDGAASGDEETLLVAIVPGPQPNPGGSCDWTYSANAFVSRAARIVRVRWADRGGVPGAELRLTSERRKLAAQYGGNLGGLDGAESAVAC